METSDLLWSGAPWTVMDLTYPLLTQQCSPEAFFLACLWFPHLKSDMQHSNTPKIQMNLTYSGSLEGRGVFIDSEYTPPSGAIASHSSRLFLPSLFVRNLCCHLFKAPKRAFWVPTVMVLPPAVASSLKPAGTVAPDFALQHGHWTWCALTYLVLHDDQAVCVHALVYGRSGTSCRSFVNSIPSSWECSILRLFQPWTDAKSACSEENDHFNQFYSAAWKSPSPWGLHLALATSWQKEVWGRSKIKLPFGAQLCLKQDTAKPHMEGPMHVACPRLIYKGQNASAVTHPNTYNFLPVKRFSNLHKLPFL